MIIPYRTYTLAGHTYSFSGSVAKITNMEIKIQFHSKEHKKAEYSSDDIFQFSFMQHTI